MNKNQWIDKSLLRAFDAEGTDAHRLCTINRGAVERFGSDILISYQNDVTRQKLTTDFYLWSKRTDFAFRRIFGRLLPKRNEDRLAPGLLSEQPKGNLQTTVVERNLKFGIDFGAGYSVGLFLDQRENRTHIRQLAAKRLLNCFAYTCSFSVAAASSGTQTVNVDLSKKWLARGRENFALNGLPTSEQKFLADDVRQVLRRLVRRGDKFDLIILDPPTFSRTPHGKSFDIERDFEDLVLGALQIAEQNGSILLSTNCASLNEAQLEVLARSCLKQTTRAGILHRAPRPVDFPIGTGAGSVWLTLR